MALPEVKDKWTNTINTLTLGATKEEGGTRTSKITVGGAATLPFLHFEGKIPYRPVIAMEVSNYIPEDWPAALKKHLDDVKDKPAQWAKRCVEEYNADLIFLNLKGIHPDYGNASKESAVELVKSVLNAVGVPLIIWGCGDEEKDKEVMPAISEVAKGQRCALGRAVEKNYKNLTATCMADGHCIITEAPIDINIQKQVNILVTEMGFKPEDIIMFQATGAMGYGMEYVYSILERQRLAALMGDKMLSMPVLSMIGPEVWKAKEAKALSSEFPAWGDEHKRGPLWEIMTASMLLQAGIDILVLTNPEAAMAVRKIIDQLMVEG